METVQIVCELNIDNDVYSALLNKESKINILTVFQHTVQFSPEKVQFISVSRPVKTNESFF